MSKKSPLNEDVEAEAEIQPEENQQETAHVESIDQARAIKELEKVLKEKDAKIQQLESKLNDFDIKFHEARGFIKKMESEVEQIRSRAQRDLQKQIDQKISEFCLKVIPSVDLFDLSLESARGAKDFDSFLKGVEMIRAQLSQGLTELGLQKIATQGEAFDPHFHEAVMNEFTADSQLDGKVSRELKAGYKLGSQVVRPAQVAVYQFQEVN